MPRDFDRHEWDELLHRLTGAELYTGLDATVQQLAKETTEKVKQATPVDTGVLQASINETKQAPADYWVSYDPEPVRANHGRDYDYCPAVEFGHRIVMFGNEVGYYSGRQMFERNRRPALRELAARVKAFIARRAH
jgi:hypothetical protein